MDEAKKTSSAYNQLCVWPACVMDGDGEKFQQIMAEHFGIRVRYEAEVVTGPDLDEEGEPVPETGGRIDLLFYIHDEDISGFAIKRLSVGIRWWEDCINNGWGEIYEKEVLEKYPCRW